MFDMHCIVGNSISHSVFCLSIAHCGKSRCLLNVYLIWMMHTVQKYYYSIVYLINGFLSAQFNWNDFCCSDRLISPPISSSFIHLLLP